jgi:hypothetical protein
MTTVNWKMMADDFNKCRNTLEKAIEDAYNNATIIVDKKSRHINEPDLLGKVRFRDKPRPPRLEVTYTPKSCIYGKDILERAYAKAAEVVADTVESKLSEDLPLKVHSGIKLSKDGRMQWIYSPGECTIYLNVENYKL